jgi:hypothetical protein
MAQEEKSLFELFVDALPGLGIVVLAVWIFWPEQKSDADVDSLPQAQISFEKPRGVFYDRYQNGANEIQKSNVWNESNENLCSFVKENGRVFENWVGAVENLDTNQGGSEITNFTIVSDVFGVELEYQFLNALAIRDDVTISKGSEVYNQLAQLSIGDMVSFSFTFERGNKVKCINEGSLTEYGSINNPEYNVIFKEVKKLQL